MLNTDSNRAIILIYPIPKLPWEQKLAISDFVSKIAVFTPNSLNLKFYDQNSDALLFYFYLESQIEYTTTDTEQQAVYKDKHMFPNKH